MQLSRRLSFGAFPLPHPTTRYLLGRQLKLCYRYRDYSDRIMGGLGKLLVIANLQSSRTEHTPFHPYRDDRQFDVRRTRVGRNSRRAASVGACEAWQTFLSSTYSDDHSRISQPNFAAPTCCWLRVYNVERKSSACGYQRHWGIVRIVSPIVYF